MKRVAIVLLFSFFIFNNVAISQTITLKTSNKFVIDSNKSCSPDFEGPHASYVGYEFCNNTGSVTSPLTTEFSIVGTGYSLSGNQATSQFIGTLAINECVTIFWLIEYPCSPENQSAVITILLKNDLGATIVTDTENVSNEFGISANATGILGTTTISNASVGQLSIFDVEYTFGTTADGGFVSFQPVGNTDFNADCFQLIGVEIMESDFLCIVIGTVDELYFQATSGCGVTGNGNIVKARYFFKSNCAGASTNAQPYAYGSSGTQLKYTGNFDDPTSITSFPITTSPTIILTKTVSPTNILVVPNTVNYTISIENTSSTATSIDKITDILPSPFTFNSIDASSGINATNSSVLPVALDTGTLSFIGGPSSAVYPLTEFLVPGNSTLNLIYTVNIPTGTANGNYLNSATVTTGTFTSASVSANLLVGPPPCSISVIETANLSVCNDNSTPQ